jgi:hypothetical protein
MILQDEGRLRECDFVRVLLLELLKEMRVC